MPFGNIKRFRFGQAHREFAGIVRREITSCLYRVFVDVRWMAVESNAGILQDPRPRRAGGSQDQGPRTRQLEPSWRLAIRLRMVAAVSSMDLRLTLMTGQSCLENSFRASLISFVTISTST